MNPNFQMRKRLERWSNACKAAIHPDWQSTLKALQQRQYATELYEQLNNKVQFPPRNADSSWYDGTRCFSEITESAGPYLCFPRNVNMTRALDTSTPPKKESNLGFPAYKILWTVKSH